MIGRNYSRTTLIGMFLAGLVLMSGPAQAVKTITIRDNLNGRDFRYNIHLMDGNASCSKAQVASIRKKVKAYSRADLGPKTSMIKEEALRIHKTKSMKGIFFMADYTVRCSKPEKIVMLVHGGGNRAKASVSFFPYMGWACKSLEQGEKLVPCPDEAK